MMKIGIPKEIMEEEGRVAAIPETVERLAVLGHQVMVERGAGEESLHPDEDYVGAGAQIINHPADLYGQADVVLKVKEPRRNEQIGKHEIDMLREGSDLIAFLHPASPSNLQMVRRLAARRIRSFTLDSIPRLPETREMDALASMSTVAGYKAVIMAVDALPKFSGELETPVGVITEARVLVVGVGVAGFHALLSAQRLGMKLSAYDVRPESLDRARELGADIIDLPVPREILSDVEGRPTPLPQKWLTKIQTTLSPHVAAADIVILSALVPGETAPVLVTGEMVRSMQPGSVIVDISIDQGGNCEVTQGGEVTRYHGVTVVGIKNLPGRVRTHATLLFARNVCNFFVYLAQGGTVSADRSDPIVRATLVTCDGKIVHEGALHALAKYGNGYGP